MNSSILSNPSLEPAALRGLTADQKTRLTEILERYLVSLENGQPTSLDSLIAENPDLAATLTAYVASLEDLHGIAAGFANNSRPAHVEPDDLDQEERRLGDFRLIREVGRGGMGIVYEARQISLDRRVALKVLPFAAVLDARQIARFKTEAQAAAQVQHPNIVPVFAIGVERGVNYYAMQFVDGQPLDRAIEELRAGRSESSSRKTAKRFEDLHTVIRLGIQGAEALHAAHEYGVVHRDIKPSNLLLDGDGKLWVTDFGLARCQMNGSLTRTGDVVGTMRYMSPEQASGQSALVDQRTDIYSLGVTLYELLTLQPVFAASDTGAAPRRPLEETPRPLRQIRPEIPVDLETVIMKAMATSRDDRYATAQAFADDMRRVLEGKPTVARPPTIVDRLAKWERRHRRIVGAAMGVGALSLAGLLVAMGLIAREKSRAEHNFERAQSSLRDAHEAVDTFGSRLADKLADVPGATLLRQQLLQETLSYYQRFAAQAEHDPALRSELAETYNKIAPLTEELGSIDDAIAAHQAARRLFAQLAADQPREPKHSRRLAQCDNYLGLVLAKAGKTEQAQSAYDAAIELQQALSAKFPDDSTYADDLALSHNNLGLLLGETARPGKAKEEFLAAIALRERRLVAQPDDPEANRNLAGSFNNLASLYMDETPAEAEWCYKRALKCRQSAVAARPDEMQYQSELALAHNNLGALQSRLNRLGEAARSYDEAIRIQTELVRRGPSQKSFRRDLAVSYNNRGLVQTRSSEPKGAEESFQRALDLHLALVAEHPDDIALQSSLGSVYNNLGSVLEDSRRLPEAATAYEQAVEHQELACRLSPEIARYTSFLSRHYFNYGRVLRGLGRPGDAANVALRRRKLWERSPDKLLSVAEELALASGQLSQSPGGDISSEQCAEWAVDTLEQAVAAGLQLPVNLEDNIPFAVLRENSRFAAMMKR